MVYKKRLVASIKSNGKILRENGDKVFLPFGSEFSILIKNLETVKCFVNIFIDGKDIANGTKFIINPGDTLEVERFVNNLNSGNKFKFIERTSSIENHRGIQLEDGLIRIVYTFEKKINTYSLQGQWQQPHYDNRYIQPHGKLYRGALGVTYSSQVSANAVCQVSQEGITVPGSYSDQKFQTSNLRVDLEGTSETIIFKLVGQVQDVKVEEVISVKHKPKCSTCGKLNKATSKFCSECGTNLSLF